MNTILGLLTAITTLFFSLTSCAQQKKLNIKSHAFYMVPTPGTIAVDENGEPMEMRRDTVFMIFMETNIPGVQWEKAWMGQKSFTLQSTQIKNAPVVVGQGRKNAEKIELIPNKRNVLFQLGLSADPSSVKAPQPLLPGEFLLKGNWNKRSFFHTIKSWTELASPLYQ